MKKGYTLLESLIGMFVIAISVICFIPAFVGSRTLVQKSQRIEAATRISEAEFETRRQAGYTALPAIPVGSSSVTVPLSQPSSLPNQTGSLTITYVDSSLNSAIADTGRKRLDVTVGWNEGTQDQGSVSLTTLMGQGGQ